jgi:hypothetical protein
MDDLQKTGEVPVQVPKDVLGFHRNRAPGDTCTCYVLGFPGTKAPETWWVYCPRCGRKFAKDSRID